MDWVKERNCQGSLMKCWGGTCIRLDPIQGGVSKLPLASCYSEISSEWTGSSSDFTFFPFIWLTTLTASVRVKPQAQEHNTMIHPSLELWPLYRESTNQVTVLLCLSRIQQKTLSLTLSFSLSFFSLRDCKSYIRSSKFLCLTSILKFDQKWTNSKMSLLWQTVQIVSMLQNIQITMLTLLKHPYISTSKVELIQQIS